MQVQATAVMADVVSGPAVGDLTGWRGNPLDAEEDFELGGAPPVTVISAAVLRVARVGYRESREDFAARARVPVDVVAGVEDGRYPAWALAYPLYAAVEAAVGVLNPGLRVAFDAGSSADLLLSFVLAGVGLAGGEPLCGGDRERQVMGRALLRWAVTGELPVTGYVRVPGTPPPLGAQQIAELRERAAWLAAGGCCAECSRVGSELLSLLAPNGPEGVA